jgi:hypothetical protein
MALASGDERPLASVRIDRERVGRIYYVEVGDLIKVGFSTRMTERLAMFPPGSVLLASHEGTLNDEAVIHDTLAPWRAAGNEWYHPSPEVLAHVDAVPNPSRRRVDETTDNPEVSRET